MFKLLNPTRSARWENAGLWRGWSKPAVWLITRALQPGTAANRSRTELGRRRTGLRVGRWKQYSI